MRFNIGDRVELIGQPRERGVVVAGPRTGVDGPSHQVAFANSREWIQANRLRSIEEEAVSFVSRREFLRDLAVLKLTDNFTDVLYSIGASRTKFLVYQFQPVMKFVQTLPHGMLIADEVGLGKTIEAGLILKELLSRGSVRRVLIVCPANLREKWRMEMGQRFGLDFRLINVQDLRQLRTDVQQVGWPDLFGIASLEGLRREELREILQETGIQLDLVVIDEAHHLRNPATQSFELGEILSDQADHILLLSATPVQTGAADLLSLLRLIEPAQFRGTSGADLDDLLAPNAYINRALAALNGGLQDGSTIARELEEVFSTSLGASFKDNALFASCLSKLRGAVGLDPGVLAEIRHDLQGFHTLSQHFTRTRKREVEDTARRRSRVVRLSFSNAEKEFYAALVAYLIAVAVFRAPSAPTTWAISMRERQAASCLQVAKDALPGLINGDPIAGVESADPDLSAVSNVSLASTQALASRRKDVQEAAARVVDADSKGDTLVDVVQQMLAAKPGRKILIFTFFKGTLRHLKKRLTDARIATSTISGDDRPEDRAAIVDAFKQDGSIPVLLSTEVGSEGLDFQFCDAVVNYDLPWNPMRVEQRIGRIDRFGQREPFIDVVSFFVEDTIDTRILERLYLRIKVFEESIGELEPILGPVIQQLQAEVFSSEITAEEQSRRTDEALRRIETLKIQYQEFEASRAELLGQGDIIRQQVEAALSSGRYVSPAELEALVAEWVDASELNADWLQKTNRDGVFDLGLANRTLARVQEWRAKERRADPSMVKFLRRLTEDSHAWCTFDAEVAQQFDALAFLDGTHPVVRLAVEDACDEPYRDAIQRVGVFAVPEMALGVKGTCGLFVYRIALTGVEPSVTMLPILITLGEQSAYVDAGDSILGILTAATDPTDPPDVYFEDLKEAEEFAFRFADSRRSEAERWATDTQQARVARQIATIERSFKVRLDRKQELLGRATDARIRRLYEGEARNLGAACEAKLHRLSDIADPITKLSIVAMAVIVPYDELAK